MTDDTRAIAADIDVIEIEWDAAVPAARVANDDSLATLLLVSRLGSVGVRPLKASEFWSLLKRHRCRNALDDRAGAWVTETLIRPSMSLKIPAKGLSVLSRQQRGSSSLLATADVSGESRRSR